MIERKIHGITIVPRGEPVRPVYIDLSGPEGELIVRAAVRRVFATMRRSSKRWPNVKS
jgi:hypothetical protein